MTTTLTNSQARWYIDQLTTGGKRWDELHRRVGVRRGHFANDPQYDPRLGDPNERDNPYKDVTPYQTDMLRRAYAELLPRLVENDAVVTVSAPADTEPMRRLADDYSAVLNTWKADIEERGGFRWQTALSDGQVRLCFGLMEWGRDDEAWSSNGVKDDYTSGTLPKRRAEEGAPWWVRFPDPQTCVLVFDESRKPGPAMYVRKYTVAELDYDMASSASSTTNQTMLVDMEQQSPQNPRTSTSGGGNDSPSSSLQWGKTIEVRCLWTREQYFEFVGEEEEPRKAFEHHQRRIRVELCAAFDTRDPDPVRRWLPALEGLYVQKPFVDRIMTLTGAATEMGVRPFTYLKQTSPGAATPFSPEDGTPANATNQSALSGTLPAGFEYGQIAFANPQQLQQWLAFSIEEFEKSKPATGMAEISATSAPWTARLAQQQASVGPKMLVINQSRAIAAMLNDWIDCHARDADDGGFGEDVHSYSYSTEDGAVDRTKVISIDYKQTKGFRASVSINPLSSAEQTTQAQMTVDWFDRPSGALVLRSDVHEAMGKKNPEAYGVQLDAERLIAPYKVQAADMIVASRLKGIVSVGVDGQGIAMGGMPVDPRQDLIQRGWKPQQPAMLPGGGAAVPPDAAIVPQVGAEPMPSGGMLAAPGAIPIGGV